MIWNVIFANKSRKLGWIWMKLGRWGWGLKRLSLARFQRHRAMGFGQSTKNRSQRRWFFVTWTTHHFCHFPWIDFRQTSHEHVSRWWLASRDTWFHISEKFPLRDRICGKTLFLGYPICAQPTGHVKCSATPILFPSPGGHPTDFFPRWLLLRDVRFPPIHRRKCPYQQWRYLDGITWREAGH